MLRDYRREWLKADVAAGLSVAAVALPVAIAYAQLAGFPPVVGLYAAMSADGRLRRLRHVATTDREPRRRDLRDGGGHRGAPGRR
jgi:hypothetical protein